MSGEVLISPTELQSFMKTHPTVLIDTRDSVEYATAHIPGAVNLREVFTYLAESTREGIVAMREMFTDAFGKAGLSGDETAVVYEDSMETGFGQSCRGYVLLRYLGNKKIRVLDGGYRAWRNAGLPLTDKVRTPTPKKFPVGPDTSHVLVDVNEMKASLDDENIVKLDVRDVDEWIGESSSPYGKDFCPRKGRIPHAVWIEWYRMMKPTPNGPRFKSPDEIMAECATVGITKDSHVIVYCFKGARAANTFLALEEAGVKKVSIYFSSWNEWSRDPDLPIEIGLPYAKKEDRILHALVA